jgi:hypothetical protein
MATRFLALAAVGMLALTGPARSQYYPTPAETFSPIRGIFAWTADDLLMVAAALEALKGNPGYDDLLIGRAIRIQEKLRHRGTVWVGAHGEQWLPPVQLTLPEMILTGHALSRYYCRPDDQDIAEQDAVAYCASMNDKAQRLLAQISALAPNQ